MGFEGSMVWASDLRKEREKNKKLRKQIVALRAKHDKLLAYIKKLHANAVCSTMSISVDCGIPYKKVSSWHKEEEGGAR